MTKDKKPVQAPSRAYDFGKIFVVQAVRNHYCRLVVRGRENLPKEGSCIIAPCHQNALMDPLVVLTAIERPTVFLARADVINMPAFARFFYFLRILPVYRIRDGKENLSKNADIFEQSKGVLMDGVPLCLMAEGRHNDRHQLLPLVKGMFRIAGDTQKALGEKPLYIVPTGIDYDDYERPFANVVLTFGEPIAVGPFMEQYLEKEPVALNQMREALEEGLRPLMLDIRSRQCYDEIFALCNACNRTVREEAGLRNTVENRFEVRQRIARRLDKMVEEGCEKAAPIVHLGKEYRRVCGELGISERMPSERWPLALLCVATVAVGLTAVAACWLPQVAKMLLWALVCYPLTLAPTHLVPRRMVKDPQFRSSFNYGIRFVLGALYGVVLTLVVALTSGVWWGIAAFCGSVLMAMASGPIAAFGRGLYENWRYRVLQLVRPRKTAYLEEIIREVSASMKA